MILKIKIIFCIHLKFKTNSIMTSLPQIIYIKEMIVKIMMRKNQIFIIIKNLKLFNKVHKLMIFNLKNNLKINLNLINPRFPLNFLKKMATKIFLKI